MSIMDNIRRRQALSDASPTESPPPHRPEILYFGCVDARLDPIDDIGIEKGKAIIFRNIGALILKDERNTTALNPAECFPDGDIPHHASIGAVLEFFLHHIPATPDGVKHIIISGHTDCGGLKACQDNLCGAHDHYLPMYLHALKDVRAYVMTEAHSKDWDNNQILRALEKESVRQSVRNLRTYAPVQKALTEGRLEIHGWVIDTATQHILEMDIKTLEFKPMA